MAPALDFGDGLPAKFQTMSDTKSATATFKTKKSVAYQTRGTFRAFETIMQRRMRDEGLQIAHFDVLRVLWEGDGVTQNYISERTFITESSTAQVINEMERLELLERHRDPKDRRKRIIHLLPKAHAMKERILGITADLLMRITVSIDQQDLECYLRVAKQLRANVQAQYERLYGPGK